MENKTLLTVTMTALLILMIITGFLACLGKIRAVLKSIGRLTESIYGHFFNRDLAT